MEGPKELYERLPLKYREKAPRTEKINGGTYRVVDGQHPMRLDLMQTRLTEEDKAREFRSDRAEGPTIQG